MPKKPNLLFIFTDEQAASTMGAYGNRVIDTPHMDRLAAESVLFENAYVSQPVCTPSRSTLLTGLYPHTNGCTENNIPLPADVQCLPELGDFGDYRTAYHGKWHLGDEVFAQHGFDEWISVDDGYRGHYRPGRDMKAHSTYFDFLVKHGFRPDRRAADGFESFSRGFCARLPEEYGKPAYLAGEASRFVRENRDHPFMLFVNFFEPHMPYFGPRDNQYDPAQVELPPNFDHELTADSPLKARAFREAYRINGHSGLPLQTEDDWRRLIANYWGLVSLVDTHLGRILRTLDETGLTENTIVVYTSDHGDMMGSHRLLAKCTMFQEAVRVPLLLRIPGLTRSGQRVTNPVSQVDLVPTLLEAMGEGIPEHLQGFSWSPFLEGRGGLAEESAFIEWNGPNSGFGDVLGKVRVPEAVQRVADAEAIARSVTDSVRTIITPGGWKFNYSPLGEHELYNLSEDPYELCNLAGQARYAGTMRDLTAQIQAWQKRTGDTVEIRSI